MYETSEYEYIIKYEIGVYDTLYRTIYVNNVSNKLILMKNDNLIIEFYGKHNLIYNPTY